MSKLFSGFVVLVAGECTPQVPSSAQGKRMRVGSAATDGVGGLPIKRWSRGLEGDSGVEYILSVLGHVYSIGPRPVTPWMAESAAQETCTV
jgi:hypothetical protein